MLVHALVALALAASPARETTPAPIRLTLRNGTVYVLREPPRITGTRVVFTTEDGRLLSLDESEIAAIGSTPPPAPTKNRYDEEDSRALGAIARQQRDARGLRAEVAPKTTTPGTAAPRPRARRARAHARPRPRPTPIPSPRATPR